jgi:hypothetical protein
MFDAAQDSQISEFPIRVGSFTLLLGSLQVEQSPLQAASMHDSVGSHIPQKIKEKILAGDYIELCLLFIIFAMFALSLVFIFMRIVSS